MLLIQQKLFLNKEIRGGRLDYSSVVHGFTEYLDKNNNLYRAHPDYRNTGEWFDWAFISWSVASEDGSLNSCLLPAQLLMFIDISGCTVRSLEKEDDSNNSSDINMLGLEEHDYWAVVQSSKKYPSMDTTFSNTSYPFDTPTSFNPKLSQRFIIDDEYLLVPLESICKPAFVITECKRSFRDHSRPETFERTTSTSKAVLVTPWKEWGQLFINDGDTNLP